MHLFCCSLLLHKQEERRPPVRNPATLIKRRYLCMTSKSKSLQDPKSSSWVLTLWLLGKLGLCLLRTTRSHCRTFNFDTSFASSKPGKALCFSVLRAPKLRLCRSVRMCWIWQASRGFSCLQKDEGLKGMF